MSWKNRGILKRGFSLMVALVMVLSCLPVFALAEETDTPTEVNPNVHVLEASALTAFKDGKKDGDTETVGDYFTIIYSSKSKVDSSTKTWEDEYTSSQRINFGGKATTEKNSIKFTTTAPATVKIWWVAGGTDREMAILSSSGDLVTKTSGTYVQNNPYLSTLELDEAGTYFLGGETNNNYIFKVEVTETPAEKVSVLESSTLTSFAQGDKHDGDTEIVGDYFTIIYSAKSKIDTSKKDWDDGYHSEQRINFGGKATTELNSIKFTTSGAATVKIWWASGENDRQIAILNSSGEIVTKTDGTSKKNDPYLSTLKLADAGTYYLGGDIGNNYIFKVEVTEGAAPRPPRADWTGVAAPAIKSVELDETNKGSIIVTVTGEVGYDAADKISVTMSDAEGKEIDTRNSLAEKSEHTLTFTPGSSGTYTFSVTATRDDEIEEHKGAESKTFDFILPLTAPVIKGAYNDGEGTVTVEWNEVKEATSYTVTIKDTDNTQEVTELSATFEGLEIGKEVTFTVQAKRVRGETTDTGDAAEVKTTVKSEKEVRWTFAAYGTSTSTSKNTYSIDEETGSVTVKATGGGGKIVPESNDGLSFYYTAIDPKTTNFELTAKVHVNSWTYSNGQEGFGLLATDRVGVHGSTAPVFTNSYMVCATKVEYRRADGKVVKEGGEKVTMLLGIGSLARWGVDEKTDTIPATYQNEMTPLETSCVDKTGTFFNVIGNVSNASDLTKDPSKNIQTVENPITDCYFTIGKSNTGYYTIFKTLDGKEVKKQYYEPDYLNKCDDLVYVGLFAARNADVTFSDIKLTTSDPKTDPPAEEPVREKIPLKVTFSDSGVSNGASYTLGVTANANGSIVIKDASGSTLYSGTVKAGVKSRIPVTLTSGENKLSVTVKPTDVVLSRYEELDSAEAKTFEHVVTYSVDEREVIYVSPTGTADAAGTKEEPTTLAAAVKNPAPGTQIILLDGTYNLESGITIQRGINGTAEAPIVLKAEEGAHPVLDFMSKGDGLVIVGDYWHVSGITSTRSASKGVKVSGNFNVVERVIVYRNSNTGLSISRTGSDEDLIDWPSYNLILNCSAYLNADSGYEDADGFEAKLTCGEGNVFDGCISAYNADDGWDLFARGTNIGAVTIKNSIAFKNGYDIIDGKEVNAGNGNGFKLGGENIPGGHMLINSVAFANKSNGITSNSCPDVKVTNCTTFGNGDAGLTLYTNIASTNTDFAVSGLISYKNSGSDGVKGQNGQDKTKYEGDTNYYDGTGVTDEWFTSIDTATAIGSLEGAERVDGIARRADGSIDMKGYLELTETAPEDSGARLPEKSSEAVAPEKPAPSDPTPSDPTPSYPSPAPTTTGNSYTVDENKTTVLPVEVEAGDGTELEVTVRNGGEATVEIPVKDAGYGTVVVIVHEDGTEEVIPDCYVTDSGVGFSIKSSVTVKVEDRGIEFKDMVSASEWSKDAVEYVSARGLLTGTSVDTFTPGKEITRGMAATVLFRLASCPKATESDFNDVASGKYYTEAVAWAAENKVVEGYDDGTFKPTVSITREQLATIVYRFAKLRGLDLTLTGTLESFGDASSVSGYAKDAMTWCVDNGIINGVDATTLSPKGTATRAQAAAMVMRLCQLIGK